MPLSQNINRETTQRFSKFIRYNVETFIDLYSIFVDNHQKNIQNYFEIPNYQPNADSFDFLSKMIFEYKKMSDLIKINRKRFTKLDDWELLDFLDDIGVSLDTINQTSKYVRSNKTPNSWRSTSISYNHLLEQHETIEDITVSELGSNNPNNDWINVALANNLLETDYGVDGGVNVEVVKSKTFGSKFTLNSVVDNLIGEKLYGIDISKKFSFQDNDLYVLSYKNTFLQSVGILIVLEKGDIPEFRNLGRSTGFIGSNLNAFDYKTLIRDLNAVFNTDDTIANFNVNDFKVSQADLFVEYSVNSFYNINYKGLSKL